MFIYIYTCIRIVIFVLSNDLFMFTNLIQTLNYTIQTSDPSKTVTCLLHKKKKQRIKMNNLSLVVPMDVAHSLKTKSFTRVVLKY